MQPEALFGMALGIVPPWEVTEVSFSKESNRLDIMAHWDGILSYFDSALTTGFLEGINSLIQSAKARARGYRNPRNMISMAYLIAGKLRFNKLYVQPT